MITRELALGDLKVKVEYKPMTGNQIYLFKFGTIGGLFLDRNQAHMLYLYLKESLES